MTNNPAYQNVDIGKLMDEAEQKCTRYYTTQKKRLRDKFSVSVRWHDGYLEEFEATEIRFGSDLLWMRLTNGKNRNIPLRSVRWFSQTPESHQKTNSQ